MSLGDVNVNGNVILLGYPSIGWHTLFSISGSQKMFFLPHWPCIYALRCDLLRYTGNFQGIKITYDICANCYKLFLGFVLESHKLMKY